MFSSLYRPAHHILYQNSHPHDVRDPAKQYKDEFSFVYFQWTPLLFTILADGLCSSVFICRRARGSSGIDDTADTGVISGAGGRLNKDLLLSEREHSKSKDTRALINRKKPQRVSNKAGLICYSILLFLSLFSSALSLSVRDVVVVVVVFLSLKSSLSLTPKRLVQAPDARLSTGPSLSSLAETASVAQLRNFPFPRFRT